MSKILPWEYCCVSWKQCRPWLDAESDLGLHCLQRPICPNTSGYYSIFKIYVCGYKWQNSNEYPYDAFWFGANIMKVTFWVFPLSRPMNSLTRDCSFLTKLRIFPKYLDRQAWANSVDPDQMLQNAASDQGLHCLPLIWHQQACSNYRTKIVNGCPTTYSKYGKKKTL